MLRAEPVHSDHQADSTEKFHRNLARANASRFAPRRSAGDFDAELEQDVTLRRTERAFIEAERAAVKADARAVPTDPEQFVAWFDSLIETCHERSEPLCSWLAREASAEQVQ